MQVTPLPNLHDAYQPPSDPNPDIKLHAFPFHQKLWIDTGPKSWFFHAVKDKTRPYQQRYVEALADLVNRNCRHIVDVGANIGMMSIQYSRIADKVSAFEPTPSTAELCAKNLIINGAPNVDLYQCALGDSTRIQNLLTLTNQPGENRLTNEATTTSDNRKIISVPVVTLDSLNLGPIDAIKIDTEGAELQVLEGAEETIKNYRPIVQAEIMEQHLKHFRTTPQGVYNFMLEREYTPFQTALDKPIRKASAKWVYVRNECDVLFVPNERIKFIPAITSNAFNDPDLFG